MEENNPSSPEEVRFDSISWWTNRVLKLVPEYLNGDENGPWVEDPGHDWVLPAGVASALCGRVIPSRSSRILVIGCGLSSLAPMLQGTPYYYENITCIDFCPAVVEVMSTQHPDMKFVEMDCRDMSMFDDKSFDVVIDKGLLDVIHCYPGKESSASTSEAIKEIHRVLVDGGQYVSMTSLQVNTVCEVIGVTAVEDRSAEELQRVATVPSFANTAINLKDWFTVQDACWCARFAVSVAGDTEVSVCVAQKMAEAETIMEMWCKLNCDSARAPSPVDIDDEEEEMKDIFRALYNSDPEQLGKYLNIEYWEGLSDGLHVSQNPLTTMPSIPKRPNWSSEAEIKNMAACGNMDTRPDPETYLEHMLCLKRSGYFLMDSENIGWDDKSEPGARPGEGRVPFERLVRTVERLVENGWPSCFGMIYDEYWHVVHELYDVVGPFLEEKGEDVVLEMDCFLWALQRQKDLYADGEMSWTDQNNTICGNFGTPHRDAGFDDCNTPDDRPEKLSVWVPLTPCTNDNGCMYVIPKEADPLFKDVDHKWHMSASRATAEGTMCRFDVSRARPLICPRGSINSWQGNLIHWGSSCGAFAKQPRMSLALTLRKPETDDENVNRVCGRKPLKRQELNDLTPTARFSIIGKAIIMYSHWFSVLKMDFEKMKRGVSGMKPPAYD